VRAERVALGPLAEILLRNDIKKTVVEEPDVCVMYDFVTDTAVGAVPSVEWLRVEELTRRASVSPA
jgi:hypothetical protein